MIIEGGSAYFFGNIIVLFLFLRRRGYVFLDFSVANIVGIVSRYPLLHFKHDADASWYNYE